MEKEYSRALVNEITDDLLHNIFNDLSVGLELYDKDGLMIDVNYSRLRSMGIKDKKDILKTVKKDKRNHGIGVRNVKETIERNHGMLQINREEEKFVAEVVLKNHIV